jgi:hypothetical protein
MSTKSDEERAREKSRDAFVAGMKRRIDEAQASGKTPEQIREQATAYARAEARQQVPQAAAMARSWWRGVRNFLIIGALALGLAIGLALAVDRSYAAPLCGTYAAQHTLVYSGLDYPQIGRSSSISSPARCIFTDAVGNRQTVDLGNLNPFFVTALLADIALTIEITVPVLFIGIALLAATITRKR